MGKSILAGILMISSIWLSAQQSNHLSMDMLAQGAGGEEMSRLVDAKLRARRSGGAQIKGTYIGSPYLNDKFVKTSMYYNGKFENNIYYRFNAYNQEIEIKAGVDAKEPILAINKDKKIAIEVNNKPMAFKTFVTSKDKTLNGYLIDLYEGEEYDLYKREYAIYSPGRPSPNSFLPPVPARFTNFTEYYFQKKGVDRIDEIVLNNRKLLKLLDGDIKAKTKAYLKDNNLNIKNEEDLIKVFEFLNTSGE